MIADDEIVGGRVGGDALQGFLPVAHAFDQVAFAAQRDARDLAQFAHIVGVEDTQESFGGGDLVGKHCKHGMGIRRWRRPGDAG